MKKTLILVLITLALSSLFAIEFSGEFKTKHAWTDGAILEDGNQRASENFAESKFILGMEYTPYEYFSIYFSIKAGTYFWGDEDNLGMFIDKATINTEYLYATYTALPNTELTLGLLPWNDRRSLILDEALSGLFASFFCPKTDLTVDAGIAVLRTAYTVQSEEGEKIFPDYVTDWNEKASDGSDNMMYFFGLDWKEFLGFQTIFNTYKPDAKYDHKRVYNFWAMPYFSYVCELINLDLILGMNYESYERDDEVKITNTGFAAVLDVEFNTNFGTPGLNVLFTTGDDGKNPEATSFFQTISSDFQNGLELFGKGIFEDSPRDSYEFDPFNEGLGILSLVARYDYPITENLTGKFAAGWVQSMIDKKYYLDENGIEYHDELDTDIGLEVNLGIQYKLFDNAYIKMLGLFGSPGKFFGEDLDNIFGVHTVLEVKF